MLRGAGVLVPQKKQHADMGHIPGAKPGTDGKRGHLGHRGVDEERAVIRRSKDPRHLEHPGFLERPEAQRQGFFGRRTAALKRLGQGLNQVGAQRLRRIERPR